MNAEQPDRHTSRGDLPDFAAEELDQIRTCMRQAIGFAKAGAGEAGYRLLCEGREKAMGRIAIQDSRDTKVLRRWDAAMLWYERYVPRPAEDASRRRRLAN